MARSTAFVLFALALLVGLIGGVALSYNDSHATLAAQGSCIADLIAFAKEQSSSPASQKVTMLSESEWLGKLEQARLAASASTVYALLKCADNDGGSATSGDGIYVVNVLPLWKVVNEYGNPPAKWHLGPISLLAM